MRPNNDPFPTVKLHVPHLSELLARLRADGTQSNITILRANDADEGEWILANAASRLMRNTIKHFGPEPMQAEKIVEQALRIGAKVALVGELRRLEDGKAVRAGANLGIRVAAFVAKPLHKEGKDLVSALGPWGGFDMAFLSADGPPPRPLLR